MKPPAFDYLAAGSVAEAVAALARAPDETRLLAGGQSLMPMLNFRLLTPARLVDINAIAELGHIVDAGGGLRIGALTRHAELLASELVAARYPVLQAAVRHVAHLAIRNRGSIGGSLAHGDPAAELPLMALLLDASLTAVGPDGARAIAAEAFFRGPLETALDGDEILTEVALPPPAAAGWGFAEVARRAGDYALAAVAATLSFDGRRISAARLAVAGAGDRPSRLADVERLLVGEAPTPELLQAAAGLARDGIDARSDLHASADYRRHLVAVLGRRVLDEACRRAAEAGV